MWSLLNGPLIILAPQVMILGRVSKGAGGDLMLDTAKKARRMTCSTRCLSVGPDQGISFVPKGHESPLSAEANGLSSKPQDHKTQSHRPRAV